MRDDNLFLWKHGIHGFRKIYFLYPVEERVGGMGENR